MLGWRVSVAVGIGVIVPVLVGVQSVLSKTAVSVSPERVGKLTITGALAVGLLKLQPTRPKKSARTRQKQKMGINFTFIN